MNESISLSLDLFKANSEIERLYQQIQILIVDEVKNKQKIKNLEATLQRYIDRYGSIDG